MRASPPDRRAPPRALALAALLAAGGCATARPRGVALDDAARGEGWARVENVREVRQTAADGCGAAALAAVLSHWGRAVTEEEIRAAVPTPPGAGLRADALRDFARRQGLQAFVIEGRPADLEREIARDRPVVVGVLRRQGRRAFPHYEVVVGLHPARRRIVTLDPARGAREAPLDAFDAEWAAAGRVALVVLPPVPGATAVPAPVLPELP